MAKIPYIESEECLACGSCVDVCPDVFQMNETLGFAEVVNPQGAGEDEIQEAIDMCPAQCIHWKE
ncbi:MULTISPECIES: ferredoxin [Desulfofundulus]|jgi:ferredoxin|uniref:Ferredoxin n=1 Tax=Desulfofundulus australicus DSM 11792 TaxID=1121425 RepID=A0A1M4ZSZ3_9FIRM|nr:MULTISPECIES: ferredoxin [Desulfofundulus]MBE3585241.1 ferredoxin [Thermoanaerobacter sp.]MCS5695204.1 ferredoxin [Desulfofundulus thermocisternus]SHF20676.1 ferredoxin [Desulfofundulus australicus DSM 11792]